MRPFAPTYPRFSRLAAWALFLSAPAFLPVCTLAAPLDNNACARLAQDLQNLKALDVDKLMENGPAWAAGHLSPGDLGLVRQYIDLDEQMRFRCSAPGSLVHLKHLEDEDEDNGAKPADDASGAKDRGENAPAKPPKPKAAKAPEKAKRPAEASSAASR
jgi:hypothetical protein